VPRIFDNIDERLLPALRQTLTTAIRADFSVGYFNLRGWKQIAAAFDGWPGGPGHCGRLLVGMQRHPRDELRAALRFFEEPGMDNQTALRLKQELAEEFRAQLITGPPTNEDEAALRHLVQQIKQQQVIVKLFLRHPLHAKLYLAFREDYNNPVTGYLGSSNLTFAGLSHQGELNVDVLEHDACQKLATWFEDRWNDRWCVDISEVLVQVIEASWAREELISPYHIYLKMAYHLSQEARAGLSTFRIPRDFPHLFEYQSAAVKIAARHLNQRGGVLIGDVVGLGKTLMATALARIFEDDYHLETLIICPRNLTKMWEDYRDQYRLRGRVLPISRVTRDLPDLRRYRLVLIDESHNLRNREGKRYRAIQEYIQENESKVILLSATPYNKSYLDLSSQLRLFVPADQDLGVRPEKLLRDLGETEFLRRHQAPVRSLAAFEHSPHADDWRDLMRLYLVRRTRSFIQTNYGQLDSGTGRRYLTFADHRRSYFPTRVPRTVTFALDDHRAEDQYARLYATTIVNALNDLALPRYGLANYVAPEAQQQATADERQVLGNLTRAGKRLMGFSRTNLFKRLESSGQVFLQSLERHILRNSLVLHAIETGQRIPIGTQDAALLDTRLTDLDETLSTPLDQAEDTDDEAPDPTDVQPSSALATEAQFRQRAAAVYQTYTTTYQRRFSWLRPSLFTKKLTTDLQQDTQRLLQVLGAAGEWDARTDPKLAALVELLTVTHPDEKVLVFTQFADTVRYLTAALQVRGLSSVAGVTGQTDDPTTLAWRFSPESNGKRHLIEPGSELRVLIATDVLSEGQNLQDAHIVVNYDLPWAIIRLIQRAGRVDRIGQQAADILCYTFLPAEGVERIIRLRERIRLRLRENAEVIGTDEAFFEDEMSDQQLLDLFTEQSGVLDDDPDGEVDLASHAYAIWKKAVDADPSLQRTIPDMPSVVYSTRAHQATPQEPAGVLVYLRTAEGNDALAWIDEQGTSVTESQLTILNAAACEPATPALPRLETHHDLVRQGAQVIAEEEKAVGGQLGRPSGARFRTYERLKRYAEAVKGTLFDSPDLHRAIEEIYRFPLRQTAVDTLNRQLRSGVSDDDLASLVLALRDEDRLCVMQEDAPTREPQIICSLGLCRDG
jgi:superfamily II DNA or RNA helicase